jgi:hypothetical protein
MMGLRNLTVPTERGGIREWSGRMLANPGPAGPRNRRLTPSGGEYMVFVMLRRRRLLWLGLKALRVARSHYLLALTAVAVAIAAAAGLGAFEDERPRRESLPVARATLSPLPTPDATLYPPFLTVTYVLVSTEEERLVWDNVEETINQRELLSKLAFEVLVVTSTEEEAAAYELIDAVRARYPWNEYVIEDLRTQ